MQLPLSVEFLFCYFFLFCEAVPVKALKNNKDNDK